MGLGDALYVQAVARHIIKSRGERLQVCTAWPDVFRPLGDAVEIAPFTRVGISYLAHYSARKARLETDQFEDCCMTAGIAEPVDLRLDWQLEDAALAESLRVPGKPIICIQLPRAPMGRKDGFGAELLPDCRRLQDVINLIGDRATKVLIGSGEPLYLFDGIDVDLSNRTTVAQLLDVASVADGFVGYVSLFVPLAESFQKPGLFVWSRRGVKSREPYIRAITPKKILHRETSRAIMDDCSRADQAQAIEVFMARSPRALR